MKLLPLREHFFAFRTSETYTFNDGRKNAKSEARKSDLSVQTSKFVNDSDLFSPYFDLMFENLVLIGLKTTSTTGNDVLNVYFVL